MPQLRVRAESMNIESAHPKSSSSSRPGSAGPVARPSSVFRQRRQARTRILIIHERGIIRDALCVLLGATEEFEVVGTESSAVEALRGAANGVLPDIVLADFPRIAPKVAEVIGRVKVGFPGVRVVVLTAESDEQVVKTALHAGADGYVLKSDSCNELFVALRSVAAGKEFVSASIRSIIVGAVTGSAREAEHSLGGAMSELTERECEVIRLIAAGHRTREIAKILSLSHKTIEKHRTSLMRKLGLRNASAVAAYAITHGLA